MIIHKENWTNGMRNGEFLSYHENGKLKIRQYYKDHKQEGKELEYYENGELKRTNIWKDGKLIETIEH